MSQSSTYDDDYATCRECFATFHVLHETLTPEFVSDQLGLQPTSAWQRTDFRKPHIKAKAGGWLLSSRGIVHSRDVRRHVNWILDQLMPQATAVRCLQAQGYVMDISCFWLSAVGHGGPTLSVKQLRRLADLRIEIWFDFYDWSGDDAEACE